MGSESSKITFTIGEGDDQEHEIEGENAEDEKQTLPSELDEYLKECSDEEATEALEYTRAVEQDPWNYHHQIKISNWLQQRGLRETAYHYLVKAKQLKQAQSEEKASEEKAYENYKSTLDNYLDAAKVDDSKRPSQEQIRKAAKAMFYGSNAVKDNKELAIKHFSDVLEHCPMDIYVRTVRATFLIKKGSLDEAIQDLLQVINELKAKQILPKQLSQAYYSLAQAHFRKSDLAAAEDNFIEGIFNDHHGEALLVPLANNMRAIPSHVINFAHNLILSCDQKNPAHKFSEEKSKEFFAGNPAFVVNLARLSNKRKHQEVINHASRAIQTSTPLNHEWFLMRALSHQKLGAHTAALRDITYATWTYNVYTQSNATLYLVLCQARLKILISCDKLDYVVDEYRIASETFRNKFNRVDLCYAHKKDVLNSLMQKAQESPNAIPYLSTIIELSQNIVSENQKELTAIHYQAYLKRGAAYTRLSPPLQKEAGIDFKYVLDHAAITTSEYRQAQKLQRKLLHSQSQIASASTKTKTSKKEKKSDSTAKTPEPAAKTIDIIPSTTAEIPVIVELQQLPSKADQPVLLPPVIPTPDTQPKSEPIVATEEIARPSAPVPIDNNDTITSELMMLSTTPVGLTAVSTITPIVVPTPVYPTQPTPPTNHLDALQELFKGRPLTQLTKRDWAEPMIKAFDHFLSQPGTNQDRVLKIFEGPFLDTLFPEIKKKLRDKQEWIMHALKDLPELKVQHVFVCFAVCAARQDDNQSPRRINEIIEDNVYLNHCMVKHFIDKGPLIHLFTQHWQNYHERKEKKSKLSATAKVFSTVAAAGSTTNPPPPTTPTAAPLVATNGVAPCAPLNYFSAGNPLLFNPSNANPYLQPQPMMAPMMPMAGLNGHTFPPPPPPPLQQQMYSAASNGFGFYQAAMQSFPQDPVQGQSQIVYQLY